MVQLIEDILLAFQYRSERLLAMVTVQDCVQCLDSKSFVRQEASTFHSKSCILFYPIVL